MELASLNPATGEVVGTVEVTSVDAIEGIVQRARSAFPAWRDLGAEARGAMIAKAGPLLMERLEELGALLTAEMGKPAKAALGEVRSCGASLEADVAEIIAALAPEHLEDGRTKTTLYRDPFGVCGAITPWNFPISMPHWLVIPALVAGNTVVLKPSEETPLIADAWAKILQRVLPPDVLQIIHGNEQQGKALVSAELDLIGFTGSRNAGAHILAAAGADLKRVLLELGGKDPMVVLDDADVDKAARFAAGNSFRNTGQVCVSTERIYVARSIHDRFVSKLVENAAAMTIGDGKDAGIDIGPMINSRQKHHVVEQVEAARTAGATIAYESPRTDGNFLGPIVLTDVDHEMDVMREETFGPVASVQPFDTLEQAIELANDTPFGLGAVVFGTTDAHTVARRIEAGMVGINRGVGGASGSPWVGAKQSGYGFHSGPYGHRQFAQVRIVSERA